MREFLARAKREVMRPTPIAILSLMAMGGVAVEGCGHSQKAVSTAHGRIECPVGQPVVGVWIEAAHGRGFADWQPGSRPNVAVYSRTLPEAEEYSVHVGCGGTPENWEQADYLNGSVESGTSHNFACGPSNNPVDVAVHHGVCRLVDAGLQSK